MTSRSIKHRRTGLPARPFLASGRARSPILRDLFAWTGRAANPVRRSSRRGYTFTEILVVTAIIGILVALLLPAVQAAREAARRMNCTKNLEQLIIAVHNYEMLHRVYPPGTVNQTGPIRSVPNGYHHNWMIQILPFLEQKNTYAHIDDLVSVYDSKNVPVRQLNIEVFRCPSAPVPMRGYSDYAGVHNDIEAPIDVNNNGTFFLNSRISYFDLKDGSSNTLFIGEKRTYQGDLGWMSGTRATLRNTGVGINTSSWSRNRGTRNYWPAPRNFPPGFHDESLPEDKMLSDTDTMGSLFGDPNNPGSDLNEWLAIDPRTIINEQDSWKEDGYYEDQMFGGASSESANSVISVAPPTDATLAVGGFGSQHPGGSQFAVGDGSIRFCSETIDGETLLQLGHRDDGRMSGEW